MTENDYQRPEGRLLEAALKADPRSARKVAAAIGISDSRLRHIISGYQPAGQGQKIEVAGPAETVARIALELGVSIEQLAAAGREDAAQVARQLLSSARRDEAMAAASRRALDGWTDLQLVEELHRRIRDSTIEPSDLDALRQREVREALRDVSGPEPRLDAVANHGDFEEPGEDSV